MKVSLNADHLVNAVECEQMASDTAADIVGASPWQLRGLAGNAQVPEPLEGCGAASVGPCCCCFCPWGIIRNFKLLISRFKKIINFRVTFLIIRSYWVTFLIIKNFWFNFLIFRNFWVTFLIIRNFSVKFLIIRNFSESHFWSLEISESNFWWSSDHKSWRRDTKKKGGQTETQTSGADASVNLSR